MNKKKWLSIFAAAIFSVSILTACAEDEGDTEDQTEETTEETTEEESAE